MVGVTIVWIRHAEKTYANGKGPEGMPAHDPGIKQDTIPSIVDQGKALIAAYGIPLYCLTSPYLRTRETALHLLSAVPTGGIVPKEYVDVNVAEYLGFQQGPPTPDVTLGTASYAPLPPLGESLADLAIRCTKHLQTLHLEKFAKTTPRKGTTFTIWVVTHGIVTHYMHELLAAVSGVTVDPIAKEWRPKPLSGLVLHGYYGGGAHVSVLPPPANITELLDEEYVHWTLTQNILAALNAHINTAHPGPHLKRLRTEKIYEGTNIIERWILSDLNATNGLLYSPPNPLQPYHTKFAQELLDKSIVKTLDEGKAFVASVLAMVTASKPTPTGFTPVCDSKTITYGKFSTPSTPRLRNLIALTSCADVTAMALFYGAIIQGGQHWGLTQQHIDDLYFKFNVRNEGFASPANSRLAGKYEAHFYSIGRKTDAKFGSLGNFFNANMMETKGNWYINPPYINTIMVEAVQKITAFLRQSAEAKEQRLVFTLLPAWHNSEAYQTLNTSPYIVYETQLQRQHYHLEQPDGTIIVAPMDTIYFCHAALPVTTAEKARIETIMLNLNSPQPLTQ